ncbi:MAG: phytanoyl-CoA dioxygenase family protein [Rhodospirillaceae bacterium]|nr:phytanoyl-CoA dioxygenase family protein [Rhodospirillaceae bacterium]
MNRHPLQPITDDDRAAYARDGAVCLRGMFDAGWIARMRAAAERVIAEPARYGILGPSQDATMTSVCYMWRTDPDFRAFAFESPAAEITGRVIGSRTIRMYHDHLFHKAPNSPRIMQWHIDATAWPVIGEMAPNIWVALTPVDAENGRIEFVAGHHRQLVDRGMQYGFKADQASGPCPDFEKERGNPSTRFITWDLAPGDAVLFHPYTPHFSKGNVSPDRPRIGLAMRLFGDDVVWDPRSYKAMVPGVDRAALRPGERPDGEFFPVLWRETGGQQRDAA